jgi:NADH-quinone oxidoreductase subunit K
MTSIPIWWFLSVAAGLFSIGIMVCLSRRNAINVLMGIELMLNAVNLNLVAFWRYLPAPVTLEVAGERGAFGIPMDGQAFALFIIALAAAEAAVGLALIIAVYRQRRTISLDLLDTLQG